MAHKILIIDDEAAMVQLLSIELESEGYGVVCAYDGINGMKLIEDGHPDLVILDVMMPEPDGFELLKRLQADPTLQDIPVILLTAKSQDHEIQKGLDLGAQDFITKPFHPGLLIKRIRTVLKTRRSSESDGV